MSAPRPFDASSALVQAPAAPADLLVTGAHVLDPRTGLDGPLDVLVRDGRIAEIGAPGSIAAPPGAEVVDGRGRHLLPAFVDPHVHLRVPGQEHKEDIVRGVDPRARVEDVGRGDQDLGGRGRRLDERAGRVEGAARAHAIDGSAVGAGTFARPARTS